MQIVARVVFHRVDGQPLIDPDRLARPAGVVHTQALFRPGDVRHRVADRVHGQLQLGYHAAQVGQLTGRRCADVAPCLTALRVVQRLRFAVFDCPFGQTVQLIQPEVFEGLCLLFRAQRLRLAVLDRPGHHRPDVIQTDVGLRLRLLFFGQLLRLVVAYPAADHVVHVFQTDVGLCLRFLRRCQHLSLGKLHGHAGRLCADITAGRFLLFRGQSLVVRIGYQPVSRFGDLRFHPCDVLFDLVQRRR